MNTLSWRPWPRTFALTFDQPDWEAQLRANYVSQVPIAADLVLDGVLYENVGVRIRGNTSYTALPAGSQKFSLKIETDFIDPDLEVMGYDDTTVEGEEQSAFREMIHAIRACQETLLHRAIRNRFQPIVDLA